MLYIRLYCAKYTPATTPCTLSAQHEDGELQQWCGIIGERLSTWLTNYSQTIPMSILAMAHYFDRKVDINYTESTKLLFSSSTKMIFSFTKWFSTFFFIEFPYLRCSSCKSENRYPRTFVMDYQYLLYRSLLNSSKTYFDTNHHEK